MMRWRCLSRRFDFLPSAADAGFRTGGSGYFREVLHGSRTMGGVEEIRKRWSESGFCCYENSLAGQQRQVAKRLYSSRKQVEQLAASSSSSGSCMDV